MVVKINNFKGINYSIGLSNEGLLNGLFFSKKNASIKSDLLFIHNKLNCKNVRIFGSQVDKLITVGKLSLDLGISPWFSPRFINSDFEITKKLLKDFCLKAKNASLEKEPLFVGNEFVLDCSDLLGKKVNSWFKRIDIVLGEIKRGRTFNITNKIKELIKIARDNGWKGPLSYASFMYEVVDWQSIKDDNLIVAQNLYWERDAETNSPECALIYEQKIEKLIKEAGARKVIISEYGSVPHKDGLTAGGGGFMLKGKIDYDAQKDALAKYFEVFKKYHLMNFLFCFENKTKNPEGSFGIVNSKNMNVLLPAAQIFAKFMQ